MRTGSGSSPPRRCGRCWRTCAVSPEALNASTAATAICSGWRDGSTEPPTTTRTRCGPVSRGCSCRHLGHLADDEEHRVPPTTSWWDAPAADVPMMLRRNGTRRVAGRTASTSDFSAAKASRLAERERMERQRAGSSRGSARLDGDLDRVRLSDEARDELLHLRRAWFMTRPMQLTSPSWVCACWSTPLPVAGPSSPAVRPNQSGRQHRKARADRRLGYLDLQKTRRDEREMVRRAVIRPPRTSTHRSLPSASPPPAAFSARLSSRRTAVTPTSSG